MRKNHLTGWNNLKKMCLKMRKTVRLSFVFTWNTDNRHTSNEQAKDVKMVGARRKNRGTAAKAKPGKLDAGRDNTVPGTSLPLNFIWIRWVIASLGINEAWNCRLPRFCTLQGIVPSLTIISRFPDPAWAASTVWKLVTSNGVIYRRLGRVLRECLPLMMRPLNFI